MQLADTAIIQDDQTGVFAREYRKTLLFSGGKGLAVRGFGMQDVLSRRERDVEIALFVGLEPDDLSTLEAVDRYGGLVRSVRAVPPFDRDRAHRPDQRLAGYTAVRWSGCC